MRGALLSLALVTVVAVAVAIPVRHEVATSHYDGDSAGELHSLASRAVEEGLVSLDNDINIVHLTDVHSWLSGHLHEPNNEADYPDVLAFFEHLEVMAHAQGRDIFLFNSGDIVDGTGLAGATAVDGAALLPIVRQMPFAGITCGNHELYINSTIENLVHSGFIDSWKGRYIQGNIRNRTTDELLGSPFAHITGAKGTELVVLGFLYNMQDNCGTVRVEAVESAVQQPWFAQAMMAARSPTVKAVVILAHMHVQDPLVSVILAAIRAANPAKAVIFLTGHTHIRAYSSLDAMAVSMESGKYLDTVGLLGCWSTGPELACKHAYITPHRQTFYDMTSTTPSTFHTPASNAMRNDIKRLRADLGLDEVIGCSDREYKVWAPMEAVDSLWGLFVRQIAPVELPLPGSTNKVVFVGSTGSFRWNLYAGKVSMDDTFVVNPFKDPFYASLRLPAPLLASALADILAHKLEGMEVASLRAGDEGYLQSVKSGALPPYVSSVPPEDLDPRFDYDLVWFQFDTPVVEAALKRANGGVAMASKAYRQGDIDSRSVFESFIRRQWPCPTSPRITS